MVSRLQIRRWGGAVLLAAAATFPGCRSSPDPVQGGTPPGIPWEGGAVAAGSDHLPPLDQEPRDELRPGDTLTISVHGHPDLERHIGIPGTGIIDLPLLGPVVAQGRTVTELVQDLRAAYEKGFLTRADVSVSADYKPREVYILGSVKKEGAYSIPIGKRLNLFQLLSLAGGFSDGANREDLVILRRGADSEAVYRVNYLRLLQEAGEEGTPIALHPDDTVIVGKAQMVYVFGRVNRPGAFPIGDGGLSVIQAVSLAGGFQRIASREGTMVIRDPTEGKRQTFRVPVTTIVNDESRSDFRLRPGDIVYVPESLF